MAGNSLKNNIGFLLQFAALTFLPLLIIRQLATGFRLIWMPALTILGVLTFLLGHWLRDPES